MGIELMTSDGRSNAVVKTTSNTHQWLLDKKIFIVSELQQ